MEVEFRDPPLVGESPDSDEDLNVPFAGRHGRTRWYSSMDNFAGGSGERSASFNINETGSDTSIEVTHGEMIWLYCILKLGRFRVTSLRNSGWKATIQTMLVCFGYRAKSNGRFEATVMTFFLMTFFFCSHRFLHKSSGCHRICPLICVGKRTCVTAHQV